MVRDIYILYIFQVRDIYAPAQMEGWPQQPGNPGEFNFCILVSLYLAALVQSVTNIFEYSNIFVTNIYSDIRSYQFLFYGYIRTFVRVKFVCTNIFGHSLVSVL